MNSQINDMYEALLEKGFLYEARKRSEGIVQQIEEKIYSNLPLPKETLRDELYGLVSNTEREGFFAGFCCAANLMMECWHHNRSTNENEK